MIAKKTPWVAVCLVSILGWPQAYAEPTPPAASGNKLDLHQGKRIYSKACARCHDSGSNGAPRLGDGNSWGGRRFEWFSVMQHHASNGFLKMPAMGKHGKLTDQDIANAVFYMQDRLEAGK